MHYYMENPSKIAIDLYEVWFPANLGPIYIMTPEITDLVFCDGILHLAPSDKIQRQKSSRPSKTPEV